MSWSINLVNYVSIGTNIRVHKSGTAWLKGSMTAMSIEEDEAYTFGENVAPVYL